MKVVGRIKVRILFDFCLTWFPNCKLCLGYHYSRRWSKFLTCHTQGQYLFYLASEFIPCPNWECIVGASRNSRSSSYCCSGWEIWWSSRCLDCPRAAYADLKRRREKLCIANHESSGKNHVLIPVPMPLSLWFFCPCSSLAQLFRMRRHGYGLLMRTAHMRSYQKQLVGRSWSMC